MSVGFGLLGSGFMAHTYAQSLAKHVPDGHLVAVAEGTRAPALAAEYGVAGPRGHGGGCSPATTSTRSSSARRTRRTGR